MSHDTTFSSEGKVTTSFGSGDAFGLSTALLSDGRIVVAGQSSQDFALARYNVGDSAQKVTIDIKPGSRGRMQVAVLSTPEFDALAQIDRATLRCGRTGEEESLHSCKEKKRDVNHDGLQDLICVFSIAATGFQKGDEMGILTAQTFAGMALRGIDSVQVGQAGQDD